MKPFAILEQHSSIAVKCVYNFMKATSRILSLLSYFRQNKTNKKKSSQVSFVTCFFFFFFYQLTYTCLNSINIQAMPDSILIVIEERVNKTPALIELLLQ